MIVKHRSICPILVRLIQLLGTLDNSSLCIFDEHKPFRLAYRLLLYRLLDAFRNIEGFLVSRGTFDVFFLTNYRSLGRDDAS
jgi:hypothetical protein